MEKSLLLSQPSLNPASTHKHDMLVRRRLSGASWATAGRPDALRRGGRPRRCPPAAALGVGGGVPVNRLTSFSAKPKLVRHPILASSKIPSPFGGAVRTSVFLQSPSWFLKANWEACNVFVMTKLLLYNNIKR